MRQVQFSVRLPKELHDRLAALAAEDERSISWVIRKLVEERLDRDSVGSAHDVEPNSTA